MTTPSDSARQDLLSTASSAIAQAQTMTAALRATLACICDATQATIGHALVCCNGTMLESAGIWHVTAHASPTGLAAFRQATEACRFGADENIPGHVLRYDQPLWLPDLQQDQHFVRQAAAQEAQLLSGFIVPLHFRARLVGALEFYYRTARPRDDTLLHIIARLETELGPVMGQRLSRDPLSSHGQWPQFIIENAGEAFIGMDRHGRVTDWNKTATILFGWSKSEAIGRPVSALIIPSQYRQAHDDGLRRYLHDKQSAVLGRSHEMTAVDRTGREFPIRITRWAMEDDEQIYFYAFIGDISERKAQETYLQQQLIRERTLEQRVFHDTVTGLANRALLLDRLERLQLQRAGTWHGSAILFIDLDGFKDINNRLGHSGGDHTLAAFADILADIARQMDTAARFAGDEFVLICDNVDTYDGAKAVAQRILDAIAAPILIDGRHITLSASIGIVLASSGDGAKTLINAADTAMYRAKRAGGNRYEVFDRTMRLETTPLWRLQAELKEAIETNQLRLYFQPIVRASDERVSGAEALIRWQHPDKGLLFPADFIPLAHDTGLIVAISRWVIAEVCRCARQWQDGGKRAPRYLSINVSAKELEDPEIVAMVRDTLTAAALDTTRIRIGMEITESAILHDPAGIAHQIHALNELGIWFSLDDFGTGYSSLTHLRNLPLDRIKIDRSFVRNIGHSQADYAITSTVVKLAHALGLAVVAEGIETREQARILRKTGTDYLQGFRFGRAQPPQGFERILWGTAAQRRGGRNRPDSA